MNRESLTQINETSPLAQSHDVFAAGPSVVDETLTNKEGPVCVVEDDDWVRDSLAVLLETHGFAVRTYRSGADFLEDSQRAAAKCLIVDQHMPGMHGLDVIAELRRQAIAIPAILITGRLSPEISRRAGELGVRAILEKPFSSVRLVELI